MFKVNIEAKVSVGNEFRHLYAPFTFDDVGGGLVDVAFSFTGVSHYTRELFRTRAEAFLVEHRGKSPVEVGKEFDVLLAAAEQYVIWQTGPHREVEATLFLEARRHARERFMEADLFAAPVLQA